MDRISDAHLHFFTRAVLSFYAEQSVEFGHLQDPAGPVSERLGISLPPKEPEDLAALWADKLDYHHVSTAWLFGSVPGEQHSIARAVRAFPHKFVGFQMINPRDPNIDAVISDIASSGLRGILLFPEIHQFFPDDSACLATYESARKHRLIVFVHLGPLRIVIQEKLGIPTAANKEFGKSQRLGEVLSKFPEVPFIVPHFGCGQLDGLLDRARETRNLYLDTSSSNAWIQNAPEYLNLETVFGKMLEEKALGADRLLFGTDSTVFPRGWRKEIYDVQRTILDRLQVTSQERQLIFSDNLERLVGRSWTPP